MLNKESSLRLQCEQSKEGGRRCFSYVLVIEKVVRRVVQLVVFQ